MQTVIPSMGFRGFTSLVKNHRFCGKPHAENKRDRQDIVDIGRFNKNSDFQDASTVPYFGGFDSEGEVLC